MHATYTCSERTASQAPDPDLGGLSAARMLLLLVYEESDPRARNLRRAAVVLVQRLRQLTPRGTSPLSELEQLGLELQLAKENKLLPPATAGALEDLQVLVAREFNAAH